MFVELLDRLRCLRDHEDAPLVATAARTVDRRIIDGTLGCPVCHAEYPVRGGVVEFGGEIRRPGRPGPAVTDDLLWRLGALLGLDEQGGVFVLDTDASRCLAGLAALSPVSQFIALDPGDRAAGAAVVVRGAGAVLPLAKGCARGIVLDDASPALVRSAARALAPRGRLVAPAAATVPEGIALVARDDEQWVGEREATPALSALARAPRR